MKKNMKKVPVIQLKSDIYHNKEVDEAEHILKNIPNNHTENPSSHLSENTEKHI